MNEPENIYEIEDAYYASIEEVKNAAGQRVCDVKIFILWRKKK